MRTIAVFHTGSDEAEELWYCELADLGGSPSVGQSFVYAHSLYEVVKTYVCLGARDAKGQLRSGTDKLLELLNTIYGQSKALGLYARLRNIGSGDAPETTSGGIMLPQASLAGDFDNVVFCTVKAARTSRSAGERGFAGLQRAVSKLNGGDATGGKQVGAGLTAIKLDAPEPNATDGKSGAGKKPRTRQ